jgi:hypothetical protein
MGPTQTPAHCVPWVLSLVVKRPRSKSEHLPQCNAENKKGWSYTATAAIHLYGKEFLPFYVIVTPTSMFFYFQNLVRREYILQQWVSKTRLRSFAKSKHFKKLFKLRLYSILLNASNVDHNYGNNNSNFKYLGIFESRNSIFP